jgi:hypothetical protein
VLIDCDTCTVRGPGCDDCVVTVLLGAPPGWRETEPTVVPLIRRVRAAADGTGDGDVDGAVAADAPGRRTARGEVSRVDSGAAELRPVVELDEVEHRAVRALAEFGLVPPLRHQDASGGAPVHDTSPNRHVS